MKATSPLRSLSMHLNGVAAAAAAAGLIACTPDTGRSSQEGNPELPTWPLLTELVIGHEGDPNYALTPVDGLAVSAGGDVFVSQFQNAHIKVFDHEGTFIRAIGRRGEAPGEFLRLRMIGILSDTLWASDVRAAGYIHYFTLDGRPLYMRRLPLPPSPYVGSGNNYALPNGMALAATASAGELLWQAHERPWLIYNDSDSLVATLRGDRSGGAWKVENRRVVAGFTFDRPLTVLRPLATSVWMALVPELSAAARAEYDPTLSSAVADVRVSLYTVGGDTVATTSLRLPREQVPRHVADSITAWEVDRLTRAMESQESAVRAIANVYEVPEHYPPLRRAFLDSELRTWLQLGGREDTRWLILDSGLTPLAWVDLPPRFTPMVGRDQHLWGVHEDELDVPTIVRYRVGIAR